MAPRTAGDIDMRSQIRIQDISQSISHSTIGASAPSGLILYENTTQGLWLLGDRGVESVYDIQDRQSSILPKNLVAQSIVRGLQPGEYYIVTDANEVWMYDRY